MKHKLLIAEWKEQGFYLVSEYCNKNKISRQAIYQSPHLYDWVKLSQNKRMIKLKK